jgi:hypothetical protein
MKKRYVYYAPNEKPKEFKSLADNYLENFKELL